MTKARTAVLNDITILRPPQRRGSTGPKSAPPVKHLRNYCNTNFIDIVSPKYPFHIGTVPHILRSISERNITVQKTSKRLSACVLDSHSHSLHGLNKLFIRFILQNNSFPLPFLFLYDIILFVMTACFMRVPVMYSTLNTLLLST